MPNFGRGKSSPSELIGTRISRLQVSLSNPVSTPSVKMRCDLGLRFDSDQDFGEDNLLWCEIVLSGYAAETVDPPLAWLHKPVYSSRGLSARLWRMELGELGVFRKLAGRRLIDCVHLWLLPYSVLKYVRRLLRVAGRRLGGRDAV